jgi:hypothetical protein
LHTFTPAVGLTALPALIWKRSLLEHVNWPEYEVCVWITLLAVATALK